jgi:hypothetical protein
MIYRRAIHVADATRACYYAKPEVPFIFGSGANRTIIEPGQVFVAYVDGQTWDVVGADEFAEHWIDEADCGRNTKAQATLCALPESYDEWLDACDREALEVRQ